MKNLIYALLLQESDTDINRYARWAEDIKEMIRYFPQYSAPLTGLAREINKRLEELTGEE